MTEYVILFPADDEKDRVRRTPEERQAIFDKDFEFGQRLEACGGSVTGGSALTPSNEARTLERGPNATVQVRSGPHKDAPGQLSGFFVVTCDDYDELVEAAHVLTAVHPVVEIRPVQHF